MYQTFNPFDRMWVSNRAKLLGAAMVSCCAMGEWPSASQVRIAAGVIRQSALLRAR